MNQETLSGECINQEQSLVIKEQPLIIQALRERKTFFLQEFLEMETQINNVVDLSSRVVRQAEITLMELQNFYEVTLVIQALKEQKTVFLDLTMVSAEIAQRVVDFLAGGAYAADCEQTCIGKNVFILTPNCVICSQLAEQE
jgi:FtsZ-interacting cell division protein YlmF